MKADMLKKLKLGMCSFDDIHFAEVNAKKTSGFFKEFSQCVISQLLSDSTVNMFEKLRIFFSQPNVGQILSEKFNISLMDVVTITSSSYFIEKFIDEIVYPEGGLLPEMKNSNHGTNLYPFIHKSWRMINEFFQCLSKFGNLNLLQNNHNLWMVIFDFVSERFSSIKISWTTRKGIPELKSSFPFTWLLYHHLRQLSNINRKLVPGEIRRDFSCSELLHGVLKNESNGTVSCLLVECIKVCLCRSIVKSPDEIKNLWESNFSHRNLGLHSLNFLSLHENFLAHILTKCSALKDSTLLEYVISHTICFGNDANDFSTVIKFLGLICSTQSPRYDELEMAEFFSFHFVSFQKDTKDGILLKMFHVSGYTDCISNKSWIDLANSESCPTLCNAISNSNLPTFYSSLLVNCHMEHICRLALALENLESEQKSVSNFQVKLLAVLFTAFEDGPSGNEGFIAFCDEALTLSISGQRNVHKIVKNILLASHEMSIEHLTSVFLLDQNWCGEIGLKGLLDCISKTEFDESNVFISIIKQIVHKRLIESCPKELLELIYSGSHFDLVHESSNIHLKLLCVKSLVKEYGLIILEDLKNKAGWLLQCDSAIKQSSDSFNLLGDGYQLTRPAILEDDLTFKFDPVNAMLSYFQHKTSEEEIAEGEHALYMKCVNRTLEYDQLETLKKLDIGELFGFPLSSWKNNASLMFLAYCKLTTSNPSNVLSKFLDYVYKYPVRIKSIFLPTMREDVISKFRETLGEKFAAQGHQLYTWYKCAGGHVYAINNCGEPQEKGKCFCGGEIGGIKHTLSQGNRRLDSYKFSEKGYNLPPIGFLSSIDSERSLKSLSLSFLRWLLHTSLAVSPKISSCQAVFGLNDEDNVAAFLQQRIDNDFDGIQAILGRNCDDTQIWIMRGIQLIFSHVDAIDLDYSDRGDRNKLEDLYLDMITPLIEKADDVINQGRELVHRSGDEYIKQALGLSFPENGPGLLECTEYLEHSKSIFILLEDEFRKFGSVHKYSTVAKYIKYRNSMDVLYQMPDLIKIIFKTLRSFNCKISQYDACRTTLKDFVSPTHIKLWNELWSEMKSMVSFIDNIHVPEQYMDMVLTENSEVIDFLPSKIGPGVCSWFLINNLVSFYNQFAKGPVIDIISLTMFVTPPCIPKHEVVAITYDTFDGSRFDFELLEFSLVRLFNVQNRCHIDIKTIDQLLFQPLKNVDSWYKILGQLPKRHPPTQSICEASPERLRSIEIAIQISSCEEYNTLSVGEISEICNLNLPALSKDFLYSWWHHVWFQQSRNDRELYIPPDCSETVSDFLALHPFQDSLQRQGEIFKSVQFARTLHMMIVEWILHNPGFNCRGMDLGEALDFFSEKAGLASLNTVFGIDSAELKVEHSINLMNCLFQRG